MAMEPKPPTIPGDMTDAQRIEIQARKIERLMGQLTMERAMMENVRLLLQDVWTLSELPAKDCPFRSCIPIGDRHGEECPTVTAAIYVKWFGTSLG